MLEVFTLKSFGIVSQVLAFMQWNFDTKILSPNFDLCCFERFSFERTVRLPQCRPDEKQRGDQRFNLRGGETAECPASIWRFHNLFFLFVSRASSFGEHSARLHVRQVDPSLSCRQNVFLRKVSGDDAMHEMTLFLN